MQSIYELTMDFVIVDACATIQSWKENQLLTWRVENKFFLSFVRRMSREKSNKQDRRFSCCASYKLQSFSRIFSTPIDFDDRNSCKLACSTSTAAESDSNFFQLAIHFPLCTLVPVSTNSTSNSTTQRLSQQKTLSMKERTLKE